MDQRERKAILTAAAPYLLDDTVMSLFKFPSQHVLKKILHIILYLTQRFDIWKFFESKLPFSRKSTSVHHMPLTPPTTAVCIMSIGEKSEA